jgi:hypothetical protein
VNCFLQSRVATGMQSSSLVQKHDLFAVCVGNFSCRALFETRLIAKSAVYVEKSRKEPLADLKLLGVLTELLKITSCVFRHMLQFI